MQEFSLDHIDLSILRQLQLDSSQSQADLAEKVHLSPSQCSRRRLAMEKSGIIKSYHARLDHQKLGMEIEAFCRVSMSAHSGDAAETFSRFLETLADVRAAWAITGDADYLIHVQTTSLDSFADLVHRHLLPHPHVGQIRSDIVLKRVTNDRGLTI